MIEAGKLAIVIANYNGYEDTKECLESLAESTFQDFFVVLVDDCSDNELDQSLERLNQEKFITLHLRASYNLGFAGANNLGIKEAMKYDPDYVLLLNNDTVVEKKALQILWDSAEKKVIQTPKILQYQEPEKIWAVGIEWDSEFMVSRNAHAGEADCFKGGEKIPCSGVSFCCCLLPAEAFTEIGLLDESYYMYHEDVDYCFRAVRKGYQFCCNTAAAIWHKDGGTGVSVSPKGKYLGYRNGCYIREKYAENGKRHNEKLWRRARWKRRIITFCGGKLADRDIEFDIRYSALNAWKHQEKGKCFDYLQPVEEKIKYGHIFENRL